MAQAHTPQAQTNGSKRNGVHIPEAKAEQTKPRGAKKQGFEIPEPASARPQPSADHNTLHGAMDDGQDEISMRAMFDNLGVSIPTWKRTLIALVASLASGYLAGSAGMTVTGVLCTAALTATGSMFISTVVYALGLIITVYAALKISQKIGMYIATGDIDSDAAAAWGWTKSLFGAGKRKLNTIRV